jgi:putative transcriptional regulator
MRRSAGLTQEGLARRMKISLSTVRQWEQGTRRPSGPATLMLEAIRDTLGKGKGK